MRWFVGYLREGAPGVVLRKGAKGTRMLLDCRATIIIDQAGTTIYSITLLSRHQAGTGAAVQSGSARAPPAADLLGSGKIVLESITKSSSSILIH